MANANLSNFFRAVLGGSLGGSAMLLIITIPMGVSQAFQGDLLAGLTAAIFPFFIAAAVTLAASVVIGLPLTFIMSQRETERRGIYGGCGVIFGALIPIIAFVEIPPIGLVLAVPGMIAGAITGSMWGDWRVDLATQRKADEAEQAAHAPNPIHELLF